MTENKLGYRIPIAPVQVSSGAPTKISLPALVQPPNQMLGAKNSAAPKFIHLSSYKEPPRVIVTLDAYNDMVAVIENMESGLEVSWLGAVTKNEDNSFTVSKIYIPQQENHGSTTEITSKGIADIYTAVIAEPDGVNKANSIRLWGHLHPWAGASVGPSAQDESQLMVFAKNGYDWFLRVIFNKDLVAQFTLVNFKEGWRFNDLEWEIDLPAMQLERVEQIRTELEAKVSRLGWAGTGFQSSFPNRGRYISDGSGGRFATEEEEKPELNINWMHDW